MHVRIVAAASLASLTLTLTGAPARPGTNSWETQASERPGWFAFDPAPDRFDPSPIDLRSLNEPRAGDSGRIGVRGDVLIHEGTGVIERFWGVNIGMGIVTTSDEDVRRLARGLAKRGVNLVRIHGPVYSTRGSGFGRVDPRRVARLQACIRILKQEGIYTSLSLYFPLWVSLGPGDPRFPGYSGGHPFALLYFDETFEGLYRDWWRAVLNTPDPQTGRALREEPAVAFLEMINEDSTLFWTFNPQEGARGNLPDPVRFELERRFGRWLASRYPGKSLDEIRETPWNGQDAPQDAFAEGRVGLRSLWDIGHHRTPRDSDTVRFLTGLMLDFHKRTYHFLKEDLGYPGLIYGSNWKTASSRYLDPLDKYANSVADVFDRHGYLDGLHSGPNAAWNIEAGQTYDDRSALRLRRADGDGLDASNPLFDIEYDGRPSIVTELNWPLPNRYRADMIPLGAAYGALQGTDALCWFAADNPGWDGLPGKFSIQTPVVEGQFPAAAWIYRKGLVRTADAVVQIGLPVEDLYRLKGTPIPGAQNLDLLRAAAVPATRGGDGDLENSDAIEPLTFLVGRVALRFEEGGVAQIQTLDLGPFVDRRKQRARSVTGQLTWDWGQGVVTLAAPSAQGVVGYLRGSGRIDLPDFTVDSPLDYGSVLLVALDDQPIRSSSRLLLQVASEELPSHWATDPESGRRKIVQRGAPPLLVREFAGTIRLRRPEAARLKVTPLDFNGYPTSAETREAGALQLSPRVPYYLLTQ